jgi:arylsulfatase A-like enzyme
MLLAATACAPAPAPFSSAARLIGGGASPLVEATSSEIRAMRVHGDGRPSIVVEVPARLRFKARIPPDGQLAVGLVLRPVEAPVDVSLAVLEGTRSAPAWSERLQNARGWAERRIDLAAWSGRDVELELRAAGPAGATVAFGQPSLLTRALPRRPNVLVYLVDCLRADHVGAHGYGRKTTPSIDAIAKDGVVFEQLSACAGWTKAAVGCLFTSQNPAEHGARGLDGVLDAARPTLAESFQRAGYTTAAFVANPIVDNAFGFDRGFDRFVQFSREYVGKAVNSVNTDAADLTKALGPFLEENKDRRFFAYVHSLDLHFPYAPKAPYDSAFVAPNPSALDLYDGELLGNDHEIGALVGELKRLGLYDDTLLVITADHGEEFGEHGFDRHGHSVFETLLHVPFVVKAPAGRGAGRRVAGDVSQLDIAPTLLSLAGLPAEAAFAGRDLAPSLDGVAPTAAPIFAEQIGARDTVYALRSGGRKYIRRLLPAPESLFFDLRRDPGESRNLLAAEARGAAPFEDALLRFIQAGQHGYQLRLSGGAGHRIEVSITTTARVHEALRLAVRTGEMLEVAPDGKRVDFRYVADHEPRHLVLSTDPPGAPLRFAISESGRPVRPAAIDLGEARHPLAVPFQATAAELPGQPGAQPMRPTVAAALWYVEAPGGTQSISDEAREGLRALGYVE